MNFSYLRYFSFIFLITILFSTEVFSQKSKSNSTEELTTWELAKHDASLMFGGFKHAYSRPLQWKEDDWALFAGIAVGTAGLHIVDERAHRYFVNQEEDIPGVIKEFGWYFGSPQNNYGVTGAIYLTGLFTKNKTIRKTGILMISAASASGLIQTISKTVTGRARPSNGGKFTFKPFSNEGGYHSFPSGHTILSFTTFYALAKQFESPWVKGAFIAGGLVSPVSRLWEGAHWLTDVALSLALSVVVVDSIDNYLEDQMYGNPTRTKEKKVSWHLQMGSGTIGLRGVF